MPTNGGGKLKPDDKILRMLRSTDSGDWLADIFDAVDDGAISSLENCDIALPDEAIAALEAEGQAEAEAEEDCTTISDEAGEVSCDGKRARWEGGEVVAKNKKSKREKLRREALNDRFMDLSESLDPSKPPKTDKATIVTEAAQVITHLRKELTSLSAVLETVQKSNDTLEKEKTGLFADKAALLQDKHKLENQLHCFMSSMPFASPPPGMAFPTAFPTGAHHMMAPGNPGMKMAAHGSGGMMPVMWGFPPLVVHTTTAEEDAKLRAPVA
mmetsp:Transcript_28949/g.46421  ORF Transcript_28949/g.46421 Transcript_28949/m.46421 type:complete len:270 (+) Transcript_28949:258-1067(+)